MLLFPPTRQRTASNERMNEQTKIFYVPGLRIRSTNLVMPLILFNGALKKKEFHLNKKFTGGLIFNSLPCLFKPLNSNLLSRKRLSPLQLQPNHTY